ncbi:glycosyltransferase family 2 protein [Mycolicibacterium moriokaense]|nr:glycosyltransferase family 2 protein [Mycolicibacterium moriokaense]
MQRSMHEPSSGSFQPSRTDAESKADTGDRALRQAFPITNGPNLEKHSKQGQAPSATNSPLVDVVIVTYGRADLVRNTLHTLVTSSPAGVLRVTVVDNNSPDETPDVVATEFPQVRLIRRTDNPGFAVSNNQALALTTAPFILLLNPDSQASWSTIEHLMAQLKIDASIGMIGCRLLLENGSFDHAAKRRIPTPFQALLYFSSPILGRKVSNYVANDVSETSVGDVDSLNGAFMLVTRQALNGVGGLDESYWMYAEDLDWCVRFRDAGWRVVYDGRVTALHVKGGSSGKRKSLRLNYHFHRSMVIFYQRHLAPSNRSAINFLVVAAIWVRFALVQTITMTLNVVAKLRLHKRPLHLTPLDR